MMPVFPMPESSLRSSILGARQVVRSLVLSACEMVISGQQAKVIFVFRGYPALG